MGLLLLCMGSKTSLASLITEAKKRTWAKYKMEQLYYEKEKLRQNNYELTNLHCDT